MSQNRYFFSTLDCLQSRSNCAIGWGCDGDVVNHHVKAIGAGNDRKKENPRHLTVISLCAKHHAEIHQMGATEFCKKYGINLWEIVAKRLIHYITGERV